MTVSSYRKDYPTDVQARLDALQAELDAQTVVKEPDGTSYTRGQLRAAFDNFRDSDFWKDDITVVIDVVAISEFDGGKFGHSALIAFLRGIEFFHGVRPNVGGVHGVKNYNQKIHVTSPGYAG